MADDSSETPVAPPQPVLHTDNVASFLDLQAEFIKRRDAAVEGKKAKAQPSTSSAYIHHSSKSNILAITKEEKKSKLELSAQRTQRIRQNEEQIRKEEQQRANQKRILEQKAMIYERMAKGERLVYEDGKEAEFLVDFHSKKRELEQQAIGDEKPSSTGADGERRFEAPPLIMHYDYTEDKGRVFGASHVPLPTMDEDAREEKIRELKAMTEETHRKRAERKRQRNEEAAEERRRLNRLRIRMGLEPIPSSDEEGEAEEAEPPTTSTSADVADIPLPAASTTATADEEKKQKAPAEKKARYGVREWDRGKVGYMHWVEAQREERDEDFAPPTFYYEEPASEGKRKRY